MSTDPTTCMGDDRRRTLRQMKSMLIAFRGVLDEELKPMGVTTAQMQMLHAVREHAGASGAQLARDSRVTPQTAQGFLARAERQGWITRGRAEENGRLVTRSLTTDGRRLLKQADRVAQKIEERLWRGMGPNELKLLNRVLARCIDNLAADTNGSR